MIPKLAVPGTRSLSTSVHKLMILTFCRKERMGTVHVKTDERIKHEEAV